MSPRLSSLFVQARVGGEKFLHPRACFLIGLVLVAIPFPLFYMGHQVFLERKSPDVPWRLPQPKSAITVSEAVSEGLQRVMRQRLGIHVEVTKEWAYAYLPLLLLALYMFRKVLIGAKAFKPAPVEIPEFVDSSQKGDLQVKSLTNLFRNTLAHSLSPPSTPVPGSSISTDLVQVVQEQQIATKPLIEALVMVVLAIWPRISYRVTGTFLGNISKPKVAIRIIGYESKSGVSFSFSGTTWEEAVELAAHATIAQILPFTKKGRNQPWRSWKESPIPTDLYASYERAKDLENEKRYDESLEQYFRAIKDDPGNAMIRFRAAGVQEKLGLFLDALDTYSTILEASPCFHHDGKKKGLLWEWTVLTALSKSDPFIWLYRYVVTLGFAEKLAKQWHEDSFGEKRRIEKRRLRGRLAPMLLEKYGPSFQKRFKINPEDFLNMPNSDSADKISIDESYRNRVLTNLFFLHACGIEVQHLQSQLTTIRRWRSRTPLTTKSVQLLAPWVKLKESQLFRQQEDVMKGIEREDELLESFQDAAKVEQLVKDLMGRGRFRKLRKALDHYNAGCVYASGIVHKTDLGGRARKYLSKHNNGRPTPVSYTPFENDLARLAVGHLVEILKGTESGFIARHREWILSDDPDLDALRPHKYFQDFEGRYFPSLNPAGARPTFIHSSEASRYLSDVLCHVAREMEKRWHYRSELLKNDVDVHRQIRWWDEEFAIWTAILDFCVNSRYWQSRVALLHAVNQVHESHNYRVSVPYQSYSSESFRDGLTEGVIKDEQNRIYRTDESLAMLAAHLTFNENIGRPSNGLPNIRRERLYRVTSQWCRYVHGVDMGERTAPYDWREFVTEVTYQRAALWQGLAEWFASPKLDKHGAFSAAVERLDDPEKKDKRFTVKRKLSSGTV